MIATDNDATAELLMQQIGADDRVDFLAVVLEEARSKGQRAGLGPPSTFTPSVALTRSIALVPPRKTFSVTLPNNHRFIPERP